MIKRIIGKILKLFCVGLFGIIVLYNFLNLDNTKGYSDFLGYKIVPVEEYHEQGKIEKNDIVIAKKNKESYNHGELVLVRYNKALHFERIIEEKDGVYITKADNNYRGNENIIHEQIEGVVVFEIDDVGIILNLAKSKAVTVLIPIIAIILYSYNMHIHNKKIKRRFKQSGLKK